jgi:hypothetical protein
MIIPSRVRRPLLAAVAGLTIVLTACSDSLAPVVEPPPPPPQETELPALGFVGSKSCQGCHTRAFATWQQSGHPYKLMKVENGLAPQFPFTKLPGPPPGSSWNDVLYVVGGYGYKSRFVGKDGFFITAGGNNRGT